MNLPFVKNDGKRRWTCFICGVEHTVFEEFKEHILEKHEEGRDYIVCPLQRCQAPVRDIKAHFRCKHPRDAMPKGIQLKATVWKDQSNKNGKLKQRKPKFRQGTIISDKNGGKEIFYRSGYECEVYESLEALNEIVAYDAEPFSIAYSWQGKRKKYVVDLSIKFKDGHVEIWEIKPGNQTTLEKNQRKWEAANAFCKARGWEFKVITEKGIAILKHQVRQQLNEEYRQADRENPF